MKHEKALCIVCGKRQTAIRIKNEPVCLSCSIKISGVQDCKTGPDGQNDMKAERIYFSPNEAMAISMGLARIIEDMNAIKKGNNSNIPWTPEARKTQAEILTACQNAARKLEQFAGIECKLPPYERGDEDESLTKQS